jgi:hypothetical protein
MPVSLSQRPLGQPDYGRRKFKSVCGKRGYKKRLKEDRLAFLARPAQGFEAYRKQSTTVSSLSLVRFDNNDDSVPVEYAHHPIVVKGFYNVLVVCDLKCWGWAEHPRIWAREQVRFDPVHYLAVLEKMPGARDPARPLRGWELPECFEGLRRSLEAKYEQGGGLREYIRVVRLLEKHTLKEVEAAVEKGLGIGVLQRDGLAQFLYALEHGEEGRFSLEGRPHLQRVQLQAPDISQDTELLTGGAR